MLSGDFFILVVFCASHTRPTQACHHLLKLTISYSTPTSPSHAFNLVTPQVNRFLPKVGCVWTGRTDHDVAPGFFDTMLLWYWRYRFRLRALRLGYNVLMADADTIFFDDPYKYLKQKPFKDLVWMNQPESGQEGLNGGLSYIQNAAPNGPAAFMLHETISKSLR